MKTGSSLRLLSFVSVQLVLLLAGSIVPLALASNSPLWKFSTANIVQSSATVSGRSMYFGGFDSNLYCLNVETGEEEWHYYAGDHITTNPLTVGNFVAFGAYNNNFYVLNKNGGTLEWKYATGGTIVSSPTADELFVYFGSYDNHLYCLDLEKRKEVWKYKTGKQISSSPSVWDGTVYVGSNDGNIHAVNQITGELKWKTALDGQIYAKPVVDESTGKIYVGTLGHSFYCLSAGGDILWKASTGNKIYGDAMVWKDRVVVPSRDKHVYAFKKAGGDLIWKVSVLGRSTAIPYGNTMFIGTAKTVVQLNLYDGETLSEFDSEGVVGGVPTIWRETLLVGSYSKSFYAFQLEPADSDDQEPSNDSSDINTDSGDSSDSSQPVVEDSSEHEVEQEDSSEAVEDNSDETTGDVESRLLKCDKVGEGKFRVSVVDNAGKWRHVNGNWDALCGDIAEDDYYSSYTPLDYEWDICAGTWSEHVSNHYNMHKIDKNYNDTLWWESALQMADTIYPAGRFFLEHDGKEDQGNYYWKDLGWGDPKRSYMSASKNLNLAIHESCHTTDSHDADFNLDLYPFRPSPNRDVMFTLPKSTTHGKAWPKRSDIEQFLPKPMLTVERGSNRIWDLYFTDKVRVGNGDQKARGFISEYNCYVHSNMANLALTLMGGSYAPKIPLQNMGFDTAFFRLGGCLYLRTIKKDFEKTWKWMKSSFGRDSTLLFLMLHDRSGFLVSEGSRYGLNERSTIDPINAIIDHQENKDIVCELRKSLGCTSCSHGGKTRAVDDIAATLHPDSGEPSRLVRCVKGPKSDTVLYIEIMRNSQWVYHAVTDKDQLKLLTRACTSEANHGNNKRLHSGSSWQEGSTRTVRLDEISRKMEFSFLASSATSHKSTLEEVMHPESSPSRQSTRAVVVAALCACVIAVVAIGALLRTRITTRQENEAATRIAV